MDITLARKAKRARLFRWSGFDKQSFERARRERRYILLHGAAVWCHWCHVMEETTYRDPEVGRLLAARFVAIRVDVDSHPDIQERYGEWGWPATIVLSPEGEELGKFRGYLPASEMREILSGLEPGGDQAQPESGEPGADSASRAALPWVAKRALYDMESYYDDKLGGWGMRQKAPLGHNVLLEVERARSGDRGARARVRQSLAGHHELLDPVWGGIYQYSAGGTWDEPHFEKLITFQSANLEAFSAGYALLGEARWLTASRSIAGYVEAFLTAPDGTFYVSQDADVGSHDRNSRFVDGNDYYPRSDAQRRRLGIPRVDRHVYAYENGLMIAALALLGQHSGDSRYLTRAARAADAIVASHADAEGRVWHDAADQGAPRFLADVASLGRALVVLGRAQSDAQRFDQAERLARSMLAGLLDENNGAFFAHTPDPDAAGVFARRRHPFVHNVLAARFLAALAEALKKPEYLAAARRTLAAISTPAALDRQGRMLGEYLLALHEAGIAPWDARTPITEP